MGEIMTLEAAQEAAELTAQEAMESAVLAGKPRWKMPGIFKADAEKCYSELEGLYNDAIPYEGGEVIQRKSIEPKSVVEYARNNEDSELHKCFDWNDESAGAKFRLIQARQVMNSLVVKVVKQEPQKEPEVIPVRVLYKTRGSEGYKPIQVVVQKLDEYEAAKKRAYDEMQALMRKYAWLSDFQIVWNAIASVNPAAALP